MKNTFKGKKISLQKFHLSQPQKLNKSFLHAGKNKKVMEFQALQIKYQQSRIHSPVPPLTKALIKYSEILLIQNAGKIYAKVDIYSGKRSSRPRLCSKLALFKMS